MAQGPESAAGAFGGRQNRIALAQRLPFGMSQDFDDGTVEQRAVIQQLPVGGAPALRHCAVGRDIQMRPMAAPGIAAAKNLRMVDDVVGQGLEGAAMEIAFPMFPPDRKDRAQEIRVFLRGDRQVQRVRAVQQDRIEHDAPTGREIGQKIKQPNRIGQAQPGHDIDQSPAESRLLQNAHAAHELVVVHVRPPPFAARPPDAGDRVVTGANRVDAQPAEGR